MLHKEGSQSFAMTNPRCNGLLEKQNGTKNKVGSPSNLNTRLTTIAPLASESKKHGLEKVQSALSRNFEK